jgi:hypothetical protein
MKATTRSPHAVVALVIVATCGCAQGDSREKGTAPSTSVAPRPVPAPRAPEYPGPALEVPGLESLEHQPLVIMEEVDPWSSGLWWGEPTFALYEDGLTIYRRPVSAVEYVTVQVEIGEGQAHTLVADLVDHGALELTSARDDLCAEDASVVAIFLRTGFRWHELRACGVNRCVLHGECRGRSSSELLGIYGRLATFDVPEAEPWKARQIAIGLWGLAPGADALPWPAGVPQPPPPQPWPPGPHVRAPELRALLDVKYEAPLADLAKKLRDGRYGVQLHGVTWKGLDLQEALPSHDYLRRVTRTSFQATPPP